MGAMVRSTAELKLLATALRQALEPAFGPDTASPGFAGTGPSAGQCAAVAVIVHDKMGGKLVSAKVDGQSHWFNRFEVQGKWLDVDLTGDQFGRPPIQMDGSGRLYEGTRERSLAEVREETLDRARRLLARSEVDDV